MEVGQLVYHINSSERYRIRKTYDNTVATLDQLDAPLTRKINGEMGYQTQICLIENLRESLENKNQLSMF